MNKKNTKNQENKLLALGIAFTAIIGLMSIGLFVINFSPIDPMIMANIIIGSIIGIGATIIAAFQITNICMKLFRVKEGELFKNKTRIVKKELPEILKYESKPTTKKKQTLLQK